MDKDSQLIYEAYVNEGVGRQAIHVAGDIGGAALDFAFPGAGAAIDIPNAALHAKHGEYIMALLSIISVIPYIGDAVGKGGKAVAYLAKAAKALKGLGKGGRVAAKGIVKSRKVAVVAGPKIKKVQDAIRNNRELVDTVINKASEHDSIKPHIPKINEALKEFLGEGGMRNAPDTFVGSGDEQVAGNIPRKAPAGRATVNV
jgi:hypothetical protein